MLMSHYALKFSEKANRLQESKGPATQKFSSYCGDDLKQENMNLKKVMTQQSVELKRVKTKNK